MSRINFLCTNGANSSFFQQAASADDALAIAERRFDQQSDYVLPISVESECGAIGASTPCGEPHNTTYTAEELGIHDDL